MAASETPVFSLKRFERSVNREKPKSVYFFFGPEEFRIKQAIGVIKTRILKDADPNTGWRVYDLAENGLAELMDDIRTVSFFGGLRGVVALNLSQNEKAVLPLLEYVKNPSPDVVLVIVSGKIDQRVKFWKELTAKTEAISFDTKDWDKKRLAADMLAESNLEFDTEACRWITENYAHSCQQLETELQKLAVYMGDRKMVSLGDLEDCMSMPRSDSIFNLTGAVAAGRLDETLQLLRTLKNQGMAPLHILSMIAWQLRILLVLKSLDAQNLSPEERAHRAGVSPFRVREYEKQTENFTVKSLKRALQSLSFANIRTKRSSVNEWVILEEEIISLVTGKETADGFARLNPFSA